jgi:hypothetical protein
MIGGSRGGRDDDVLSIDGLPALIGRIIQNHLPNDNLLIMRGFLRFGKWEDDRRPDAKMTRVGFYCGLFFIFV